MHLQKFIHIFVDMIERVNTNQITTIDSQTGEILDQVVQQEKQIIETRKIKSQEEFIMIYLQDLSSFLRIDNATQIKLLALIWRDVAYNNPNSDEGNVMAILKDDKEKWAKEIDVSTRTIDNCLSALIKKNLLQSESRGKYKLNPKYYFKGSSTDRRRILNLQVNYEFENKE